MAQLFAPAACAVDVRKVMYALPSGLLFYLNAPSTVNLRPGLFIWYILKTLFDYFALPVPSAEPFDARAVHMVLKSTH